MPRRCRAAGHLAMANAWVALCWGCGNNSPSTPTPTSVPAPTDPLVTFSGHVTATNGAQPLPNVKASFSPEITALTDATGTFTMRFRPGTTSLLTLAAGGIVARSVVAAVNQTRTLDVDAITLDGRFDLKFYRYFVRDNLDSPGVLRPLRRWTDPPQF